MHEIYKIRLYKFVVWMRAKLSIGNTYFPIGHYKTNFSEWMVARCKQWMQDEAVYSPQLEIYISYAFVTPIPPPLTSFISPHLTGFLSKCVHFILLWCLPTKLTEGILN